MIGWHIELGYNSGYTGDASWNHVLELAHSITVDEIKREARKFAPEHIYTYCAKVAETYETWGAEHRSPISEHDHQIMIVASGGVPYREAKEHVARAFVRLLMLKVHAAGFDISITVA